MGVAGVGKTTVGERLADATGFAFVDGDRLHPRTSIDKMSSGQPLIDEDRWPWLATVGKMLAQSDRSIIIGCPALRRAYRDRIRAHAGGPEMRLPSSMPLTAPCAKIHRMLTAAGLGGEDQAALMDYFKGPDKEQFG